MTIGLVLALLAISLAFCASAYQSAAADRGWRYGSVYHSDIPVVIAMTCIVIALVKIGVGASRDHFSWWVLLLVLPAWLIGTPIILSSLKEMTGPVALFGGPLLAVVSLFVR